MKNWLSKRFHVREKLPPLPEISDKWEKRFFTVKIGLRIISIMVSTSKKNTVTLKNTVSPKQERILLLLFPLVETIIKIRKNQIFKK